MAGRVPRRRHECLPLIVTLAIACGGGESTQPDRTPAQISIGAVDTLRSIGASAPLTVTVRNAAGEAIPGASVSSWETSDASVAAANSSGVVTALANGEATITARSGGVSGSVKVVVRQRIDPSKSSLTVTRPLLFVGDTVRATLTLRDALDKPIAVDASKVALAASGGTSGLSALALADRGNAVYSVDFVGTGMGGARPIVATFDGTSITTLGVPTLSVVGFTKIAAQSPGPSITCGVITTGDLYCWGEPNPLYRGTGATAPTVSGPTLVAGGGKWRDVDLGAGVACAISDVLKLACWGLASGGWLGNGVDVGSFPAPVPVATGSSFVSVDVGVASGWCAVTITLVATCTGSGVYGRLGNGADTTALVPVGVASGSANFTAIATSSGGTCGVTTASEVRCWGYWNTLGIGPGPYPDVCAPSVPCAKTPVRVSSVILFQPIVVRDANETCALGGGAAYCWGSFSGTDVPTQLQGAPAFKALAAGDLDYCGIALSGTVYCWGTNRNGRFGLPADPFERHPVPEAVPGGQTFIQISMGQSHMCGVATDGNAWCWGSNDKGELGDRTTTRSPVPVRVKLFAP